MLFEWQEDWPSQARDREAWRTSKAEWQVWAVRRWGGPKRGRKKAKRREGRGGGEAAEDKEWPEAVAWQKKPTTATEHARVQKLLASARRRVRGR